MPAERYSIDYSQVASLTGALSEQLDTLSGRVTIALDGVNAALDAVAAEADVSTALSAVASSRQRTGPGMVSHGGAVIAATQTATLSYLIADNDMAATTLGAETNVITDASWTFGDNDDN